MKEKLISLLGLKYNENKSFQSSDRTTYEVFYSSFEEVKGLLLDLDEFVKSDMITNLAIFVRNEDTPYKIIFSVDFGYEDKL